jgi:hypothetical protein
LDPVSSDEVKLFFSLMFKQIFFPKGLLSWKIPHHYSYFQLFFQVNYFKDHTKLIVGSLENNSNNTATNRLQQQQQYHIVTFINSERQARSWYLTDLGRRGATPQVKERMAYVASVLEEFSELDDKPVCF